MVTVLGGGRFVFELVQGPGKGTADVVDRWNSLWPLNGDDDASADSGVFAHVGKTHGPRENERARDPSFQWTGEIGQH